MFHILERQLSFLLKFKLFFLNEKFQIGSLLRCTFHQELFFQSFPYRAETIDWRPTNEAKLFDIKLPFKRPRSTWKEASAFSGNWRQILLNSSSHMQVKCDLMTLIGYEFWYSWVSSLEVTQFFFFTMLHKEKHENIICHISKFMTRKLIYGHSTCDKVFNNLNASQSFLIAVSLLNNNLSYHRDIINISLVLLDAL